MRSAQAPFGTQAIIMKKFFMCNEPITIHNFVIPFGTICIIPVYYEHFMNSI